MIGTAAAASCKEIMKSHAFLSRAQFQCEYQFYNQEMIAAASACSRELGEIKTKELVYYGFNLFDQHDKEKGRKQICQEVLRNFPKMLKP